MSYYHRRLPHWHPDGASIFVTWRLHGSLPHAASLPNTAKPLPEGKRFAALDHQLDLALTGPTWLKHTDVARAVVNAMLVAEQRWELCQLSAWVVMSNHVHALLMPRKPLREVTRAVKSTSAREANRILGRTGQPFWQDESYDHWVRNPDEFERIVSYIERNPVTAGLVERVEHWRWSSAFGEFPQRQVGDLPHVNTP